MNIIGPDNLLFGVDDVGACSRYLIDYGLDPVGVTETWGTFEGLDGTSVTIRGQDDTSLPPPLGITASYLVLDGLVLELMHYSAPAAAVSFQKRTMNEPGLTHLSISVDDIRATATKATEYGGEIIEESDVGLALFIRDPDGQLLELLPSAYRAGLPPKPKVRRT